MRKVMLLVLTGALLCATAFSQINLGKNVNWRVYNYEPATKFLWDINKAAVSSGGIQFPIQSFVDPTHGSFAVYLYANYNVDITGKIMTATATWTSGTYETRSTVAVSGCEGTPGYARLEFQDVTSGPYSESDYWWSTGIATPLALDLNAAQTGTLTASLADPTLWSNLCGHLANDTNLYPDCITGNAGTMTPAAGFAKATKNVKLVGLAFGSSCRYASGVAIAGTSVGNFTVSTFTIE